jgi:glucosamine 6-phosphate synthetase-like amidotransferase/phosphosugar isomerase protein
MCGIFGVISNSGININKVRKLVQHSKQRGKDSSGLIHFSNSAYNIDRADYDIEKLLKNVNYGSSVVLPKILASG